MIRAFSLLFACLSLCVFLTGCGGEPTVSWSGTVTIDGQPIPSDARAMITIRSSSSTGQTRGASCDIVNGQYKLKDVPKGPVLVSFNIFTETPAKNKIDAERGAVDTKSLIAVKWEQGIEDNADSNNSAKNFDLTAK